MAQLEEGRRHVCTVVLWLVMVLLGGSATGETLVSLAADSINRITVAYGAETYHYDLYVPVGYAEQAAQEYPVLFIFSPSGNAALGEMANWVRQHQWLAVMLVEAQNGPWEPIDHNFYAAHDDVLNRVRVDPERKYVTGFSGGARAAARYSVNALRPGFHGLFLQGAGAYEIYGLGIIRPDLYVFASFGDQDGNLIELTPMQQAMPAHLFNHLLFSGGHVWAPQAIAEHGLDWLEAQVESMHNSQSNPDGPSLHPAIVGLLLKPRVLYQTDLNSIPEHWTATPGSAWQWTIPGCGPSAGVGGSHAFCSNPNGTYASSMASTYLVSPPIDCGGTRQVLLEFQRWLEVEGSSYDHATIEVSRGDGFWHLVWQNPSVLLADTAWTTVRLDISAYAAGEPTVMVRWGLGPTDATQQYCGWNIDEIRLLGR
jgi:dienelactone hydrolase